MLESPQVYRERGYIFVMYFNEGNEPPHVHVTHGDHTAKFWLDPLKLQKNYRCTKPELRAMRSMLQDNAAFFMEQWNATQAQVKKL